MRVRARCQTLKTSIETFQVKVGESRGSIRGLDACRTNGKSEETSNICVFLNSRICSNALLILDVKPGNLT